MVKVKLNRETMKWELLPKGSKEGMYLDGYLYKSFSHAQDVMRRKDVDLPIAVTGYPGTGKSTTIIQIASFCDPTFNHTRMHQCAEDFIKAVQNAKQGEAHVLDESYNDLNSASIRREAGRALLNVMNIIRQKRLYIFIALPDFFDLTKNIAIFRTRWLIHCYSESFGDIGRFAAFDRNAKKLLYIYGKKNEDYNATDATFYGTFTKRIPENFDWDAYVKMKEKGLREAFTFVKNVSRAMGHRDKLLWLLYDKYDCPVKELSKFLELSSQLIHKVIKEKRSAEIVETDLELNESLTESNVT